MNQTSEILRKLGNLPQLLTYKLHRNYLHTNLQDIIVNEYPRSGGTWIAKLISTSTRINKLTPFSLKRSVLHEHLIDSSNAKQIYVLRDPRDVIISNYFHCFFTNEMNNAGRVIKMKEEFSFDNYDNVKDNLKQFISRMLTKPFAPPLLLQDFIDAALSNPNGLVIRYEDMKLTPLETMRQIVDFYEIDLSDETLTSAIEQHDISHHATGRRDRHIRKGIIGDWKNHFNADSAQAFNNLAGRHLIKLGYEEDESWLNQIE